MGQDQTDLVWQEVVKNSGPGRREQRKEGMAMRSNTKVLLVLLAVACMDGCARTPTRRAPAAKPAADSDKETVKPVAASPAAKPADAAPVARPAAQPVARPAARPVAKPATKPKAKPKPAAKGGLLGMAGSKYYKIHPMFHPFPEEKKLIQSIDRFGPVGIGIELLQPAFRMRIKNVEEGSPAAATGKLKKGQLIDSINGRVLKEMDPRQILGDIIAKAEATDGVVKFVIRDKKDAPPAKVVVKIPVLGPYSETWPLGCAKSDRIVREMAGYLARTGANGMGLGALFLLSTGDKKDLDVVRGWMKKIAKKNAGKTRAGGYPWHVGYNGISLCEYYLRTGDKSILPTIKAYANQARATIYNGSWGQKGAANYNYMAGGHMNAAGVHCVTFLLLAKECGVDVDEFTMQSSLKHFYRYAGHGAVSYGDGVPEPTYVDNGKNGGLAFAMAAAASLTPEGEDSLYAKARDASAITSFYSTSWMLHGHTGGGIGEIWRGPAMGLLYNKSPNRYREFMDSRAWFLDISRRFDGSFGIVGGGRYDTPNSWAIGMALNYTVPRKKLRIYGAPKTRLSRTYQLPKRPWGTAADDKFLSLDAAPVRGGKPHDVEAETLVDDCSWPVLRKLAAEGVSDELLLRYSHHPDFNLRSVYCAKTIRTLKRDDLVLELLRSKDPRVRRAGIVSIDKSRLTDEMVRLLLGMVDDPRESWWVVLTAMDVLGSAKPELVAPHVDRLLHWLHHDDWWLNKAAMTALTRVSGDDKLSRQVLPIVGRMISKNTRAVALAPVGGIVKELQKAGPGVQRFAVDVLGDAYENFPKRITVPGGQDMSVGVSYLLRSQAWNLSQLPGGFDKLLEVSSKRFPGDQLPHREFYMKADAANFGPETRKALKPIVLDYLIPKYMGESNHIATNREYLLEEGGSTKPYKGNFYRREPRMAELVRLYNRIGVRDYDWKVFGPDLDEIEWEYHTFDPPEEKLWAPGWRYREVSFPKGMKDWVKPEFDPRAAGWKKGFAPFGQWDGKLVGKLDDGKTMIDRRGNCSLDFCRCYEPMQTLWDKEVLIMRTKIKLPEFKDGHRYRILIGGMTHVPSGEGFRLYFNGKKILERNRGIGRREGGKPTTYYIDKAWWPAFDGEVTVAAIGFLHNFGGKHASGVKRQHFSIWFQEMKVPQLTDDMFSLGRTLQPMRCAPWQATKENDDMYRYSGTFERNALLVGQWTRVGQVASIEEFRPGTVTNVTKAALPRELTLKVGGKTHTDDLAWSGDTLMDLKARVALKMTHRKIRGAEYLFIEAGGFSKKNRNTWVPDHPVDWKPALYVMKRK